MTKLRYHLEVNVKGRWLPMRPLGGEAYLFSKEEAEQWRDAYELADRVADRRYRVVEVGNKENHQ